ncbi:MAG: hypothetical protein HYY84_04305 [Deltaproteobacteria bacterium]|nr:hypothetical protein [Deltaproteobacteria bacterium]
MGRRNRRDEWTSDPSTGLNNDDSPAGAPLDDETLTVDESDLVDETPLELERAAREALEGDVRRLTDEASRTTDAQRSALLLTHAGNLIAWRAHDSARATTLFLAALEKAPEFVPALRGARHHLIARHKFGPALDLYEREIAVAADAESRAALHVEAALFVATRLGDFDRARLHLRRAVEAARVEGVAERELWRFLARLRDEGELERHLASWFESAKLDRASVGFRLALMKERRGEREQALDILAPLLDRPGDLAPAILAAYAAMAGGLGRRHEEARALDDLGAHLSRNVTTGDGATAPALGLELLLGVLAEERSPDLKAALNHYRHALSLVPHEAVARAALCDALARERRHAKTSAESLALAQEAVEVSPDDAGAWLAVAETLEAAHAAWTNQGDRRA